MKTIKIGAGAGYAGDRIEPAVELAEKGEIQYLVFECLAERTIALAQQAKMKDPASGYDPLLTARMKAVLGTCKAKGIKIVTNMGAANPLAAAEKTREIARALGLNGLKIAAVTGDDVLDAIKAGDYRIEETGAVSTTSATALFRRTPISGQSPSWRRSQTAQMWSSRAGSATRLCSWARLCTSLGGRWTTGTRSGAG